MADDLPRETPAVEGPLLRARFGGILEGQRVSPRSDLELAADAVRGVGIVGAELEIDGGRFSLLFDDALVEGAEVTPDRLETLVKRLDDLLQASGAPESAESTLHCTEVFPHAVRETLFFVRDGTMQTLCRVRPAAAGAAAQQESAVAASLRRIGLLRGVIIIVLLLVGFGVLAWQSGYLGRIFSGPASELGLRTGPFGKNVALSVKKSWGNYKVTIRRGPDYPKTPAEFEKRKKEAKGLEARAALDILSQGGQVYVLLLDRKGTVLESNSTDLFSLLSKKDGEVTLELDGRLGATAIRLSLSGKKPK